MATITIYQADGSKSGEVELDPKKVDTAIRRGLLKEALIAWQASQRQGTHKTKDRGEVAGGGKKPWRQKGTGRARQGSTRSPQWVGGGHAHALMPRDYAYGLPAASRAIALRSAIRFKLEGGVLCAVDGFDGLTEPKTRSMARFLARIGLEGKGAMVVSEGHQPNLHLSARNIPKITVSERRNLNAGEVLSHANLIFTKSALDALVAEVTK